MPKRIGLWKQKIPIGMIGAKALFSRKYTLCRYNPRFWHTRSRCFASPYGFDFGRDSLRSLLPPLRMTLLSGVGGSCLMRAVEGASPYGFVRIACLCVAALVAVIIYNGRIWNPPLRGCGDCQFAVYQAFSSGRRWQPKADG